MKLSRQGFAAAIFAALTFTACAPINLNRIEESQEVSARTAKTTAKTYNSIKGDSGSISFTTQYNNLYTIDGSKVKNTWNFAYVDLSEFNGQTVTIDFSASMQSENRGNATTLYWNTNDSSFTAIAKMDAPKGSSSWKWVSGSATVKLGSSNSMLYLSSYGLKPSDFRISVSSITIRVTGNGSSSSSGNSSAAPSNTVSPLCPQEYASRPGDAFGKTYQYWSSECRRMRNIVVSLPENYNPLKKYPVMFFLHGFWEKENAWNDNDMIVRKMIRAKKAEEMIIVHPFIYVHETKNNCSGYGQDDCLCYDRIVKEIPNCILPWLKQNFSIREGRENTAVIGFSMGGRESLACGLLRPDVFGWVGAICPAPGLFPNNMGHPGQLTEAKGVFPANYQPKLLMICAGEKDTVVSPYPQNYHQHFTNRGIPHTWWVVPGSGHADPAVSAGIYNFASRIFK